ncbi:uncharacterized protein SPPG_01090 [Spizellomyces punctatus DAOM BR117]|uniref:L domain-like protein n=1 Tax=Spizellomyces punctatus (strain DAOM BR117) TaxID=645134 RepID=A0A0L0HRY6_SPIPD|nr:uncharacterized protein SPPG_01090 [Spizellomyces punctatus DAOM BR117]KND03614.1 hypothetical protein SPPG_01090 [Spizellomyces punctatus DAOM BR117]|eukprot:XP_016611653.1 hypothetical protein SPPG_01090 [Spizellomyces punctatus DAOM BR117]
MGAGISKEHAGLPVAYALIDSGESSASNRESRPHRGQEIAPSLAVIDREDERRRPWGNRSERGERQGLGGLFARAKDGRLPSSFSLNDLDILLNESSDEVTDGLTDVYRLDRAAEESLRRNNMKAIKFGQLTSVSTIGLCSQALVRLSPNIGLLSTTTTLHLCCNDLTEIPPEIGHMKNLVHLSVASNRLTSLPDTIGFLTKLIELKASDNLLETIPSSIGSLKKLASLHLENNCITSLPPELGQVKTLTTLELSKNPLTVIPAELNRLKFLRTLALKECPLRTKFEVEKVNSPPTLKELAARVIVRQQLPILEVTHDELKAYLASAHKCTFCGGPYFESVCLRGRIVERNDVKVPLEYRLCCPHWNSDEERLSLLFCPLPETAPSPIPSAPGSPLPSPPGSPASVRRRKPTMTRSGSCTLPLSSLTKNPSLPSLPTVVESRGLKSALLRRSGLRNSRSLSFTS